MLKKKHNRLTNQLKSMLIFILTVFFIVGCSGGGDDPAPSDNNTPTDVAESTGTARGSYTYDPETNTLSINITSSSFQVDCGPQISIADFTVLELTATTIRLTDPENDEIVWTRGSGSPDSIIGEWHLLEGSITDAIITVNADGTFSVSGTFECGDSEPTQNTNYSVSDLEGTWTGNINIIQPDGESDIYSVSFTYDSQGNIINQVLPFSLISQTGNLNVNNSGMISGSMEMVHISDEKMGTREYTTGTLNGYFVSKTTIYLSGEYTFTRSDNTGGSYTSTAYYNKSGN